MQQGYPSYSQCLPNFEHEFQCWLNDFTYTRNPGHLRQTKKVAMCIDRLLPCLKVFIYGKWWFSTCFFFNILVGLGWVLGGFSGSAPAGVFLVDTRLPMVQSTCILLLHRGVGQWLSGYTDKNYSIISARSSRHWDNGFEQSVTPTKVPDLCLNAECIRKYTLHRYNIWKIRSQIYGFIYIHITHI